MANTIGKTKTAKIPTKSGNEYSYTYTDLASINKWLDENEMDYYQEIETNEINGKDYILTYRFINGEWEEKPKRGCQVVDATLLGTSNPAQQNGSALSYARRYSVCLAFGLATEDDDAQCLSKPKEITKEEAENYTFKSGKHEGWTLKRVVEEDKSFLNYLLNNGDEKTLKMIEILTGKKPMTEEEQDKHLENTKTLMELIRKYEIDLDKVYETYKIKDLKELSNNQYTELIAKLKKKYEG